MNNTITSEQSESVHMDDKQGKSENQSNVTNEIANWTNVFSKCPVEYDLPFSKNLFVGRQRDISEIIKKLSRAHLVSISGAPGFGKSTLAIRVGHKMLELGASVRYIDTTEAFSHTKSQRREKNNYESSHKQVKDISITDHDDSESDAALTWHHRFTTSSGHNTGITADEILVWSKTVKCHTVLILN